jgi:hypothetical protein
MLFSSAPIAASPFSDPGTVSLSVIVSISAGVEATGTLGTQALSTNNNIAQEGFEATSGLGSEVVVAKANQALTGEEITTAVGTVSLINGTGAVFSVTGLSATGDLGASEEEVIATAVVVETGLEATAALGAEDVEADAIVIEDGVAGTTALNWSTANLVTNNILTPTGFSATAALGDNGEDEGVGDANVLPTGVSAACTIAGRLSITVIGNLVLTPTGVVGTGGTPNITMYGDENGYSLPPAYLTTEAYRDSFWKDVAA